MSATVLGCGHASHLMDEINSIKGVPQVHLHFLSPPGTQEASVELCCHGCGESLLVYYREDSRSMAKNQRVRDDFVRRHEGCPNRKYERNCPNYRSSFKTVDLRARKRSSLPKAEVAMLPSHTAGQSSHGRGSQEAPRRRGR